MSSYHRIVATLLALLALFSFLIAVAPAYAEQPSESTNRFNVVLVVDKSGSLRDIHGHGTDPDGLRFDALRLFLGLLTEQGNNVGAIVFDEQIRYNSGLRPVNSMEEKKELIQELEAFSPSYDTDIGSAVFRAVELLRDMKEENDLPCMILLFSDGMTDFSVGDHWTQMQRSWAVADQALNLAKTEGITINGILLDVDGKAADGEVEFQLYTHGTGGAFVKVGRPEDLTTAFQQIYKIINNTEYTGAQRVSFSDSGEAEYFFPVPSFGVDEVNVVVEGEDIAGEEDGEDRIRMEIFDPAGKRFDLTGHDLTCSRYLLVKIPRPGLGLWRVRLKGAPEDWVDVTMVYNASMVVSLTSSRETGSYRASTPYTFTAQVTELRDEESTPVTEEQLRELDALLTVEELATGIVREVPMTLSGDSYTCDASFARGGDYRVSTMVSLGDFRVSSNTVEVNVEPWPLVAKVLSVTDMLKYGQFRDGVWELELGELFGVGEDVPLNYSLSDDCNGVLTIEDGVLRAHFRDAEPLSFILTATDLMDQSASISFQLTVPTVTAKADEVSNMLRMGSLHDFQWELELDELFDDPKGLPLSYAVSDNCDGAVTVEDGVLRVDLHTLRQADFTLTATDTLGLEAAVPFSLQVPGPSATVGELSDTIKTGLFQEGIWEHSLDGLFREPKGTALRYALSDDFDGAAEITDGQVRVNMKGLKQASFKIEATDEYELGAAVSVTLTEKNMTPIYLLCLLAALLGLSLPAVLVYYLRRR